MNAAPPTRRIRPILMSGPMVCACLRDENPKTQTRRIVKVPLWEPLMEMAMAPGCAIYRGKDGKEVRSPYGYGGAILWVRECYRYYGGDEYEYQRIIENVIYKADQPDCSDCERFKPSIHMPYWACRLWLKVVSVRVERVQDITEADAIAEGIEPHGVTSFDSAMRPQGHGWKDYSGKEFVGGAGYYTSPIDSYRSLWDSINGKGSFKANPWVWRIEFRRTEKPQ